MGKKLFLFLAVVLCAGLITGCASTKDQELQKLQDFLVGSREAEYIEKTDNPSIDALSESSTILYKRVGVAMREYIEETRGDMATILVGREIRNLDTQDADGIKIAEGQLKKLTEIERKDWTPESVYAAAKSKRALQFYIMSQEESEAGATLKNSTDPIVQAEIAAGKKVYDETLSQENWNEKIAEMQALSNDLTTITNNAAVLSKDITQKISSITGDYMNIGKNIEELKRLEKASSVLTDGVENQIAYTGKAIPWLISEYTAMSKL